MMTFDTLMSSFMIQLQNFRITDAIDILIVAVLFYQVIQFIRRSRAASILKGLVLLLLMLWFGELLDLNTTSFLLRNTMQLGVVAVLVVFQPELRSALEQMGRSRIGGFALFGERDESESLKLISEVCTACDHLSQRRIGALIIFERSIGLNDVIKSGVPLDSELSAELLESIFFVNNPLHDGAVVVRNGRISAAACLLPLTQNHNLSKELGTRHRAAIGLSEVSDALVVVVSEETGKISIVTDGLIRRGYRADTLQESLQNALIEDPDEPPGFLKRLFQKKEVGK